MIASERLREMGGKLELLRIGDTPPPVLEILFWDELVAVVEAAERFAALPDTSVADATTETVNDAISTYSTLTAALAALLNALEEK